MRLASSPIAQSLPITEDDFVYIYLGIASDNKSIALTTTHPIYEFRNGSLRLWTNQEEISSWAL